VVRVVRVGQTLHAVGAENCDVVHGISTGLY